MKKKSVILPVRSVTLLPATQHDPLISVTLSVSQADFKRQYVDVF